MKTRFFFFFLHELFTGLSASAIRSDVTFHRENWKHKLIFQICRSFHLVKDGRGRWSSPISGADGEQEGQHLQQLHFQKSAELVPLWDNATRPSKEMIKAIQPERRGPGSSRYLHQNARPVYVAEKSHTFVKPQLSEAIRAQRPSRPSGQAGSAAKCQGLVIFWLAVTVRPALSPLAAFGLIRWRLQRAAGR